jgi:hypothetical protein
MQTKVCLKIKVSFPVLWIRSDRIKKESDPDPEIDPDPHQCFLHTT